MVSVLQIPNNYTSVSRKPISLLHKGSCRTHRDLCRRWDSLTSLLFCLSVRLAVNGLIISHMWLILKNTNFLPPFSVMTSLFATLCKKRMCGNHTEWKQQSILEYSNVWSMCQRAVNARRCSCSLWCPWFVEFTVVLIYSVETVTVLRWYDWQQMLQVVLQYDCFLQ